MRSVPRSAVIVMLRNLMTVCLAGCAVSLSGCLFCANATTTHGGKGEFVGHQTLSQIVPGQTTRAWLIATLGQPTEEVKADEHTTVLKYEYVATKRENATMLFVFTATNTKTDRKVVHVQLKDGVVEKYWITS